MNLWDNNEWEPMLLEEVDEPFNGDKYIYEVKFDGIRACIYVGPTYFKIINRYHKDITYLYPELKYIQKIVKDNIIFDGEIIIMDNGKPSFSKLQERAHLKDRKRIDYQATYNPVTFVAFDILYKNKNITNLRLLERKKFLESIKDNKVFVKSKFFNNGIELFARIKKLKLEGIVAKEKNSKYFVNMRSNVWIKIKNMRKEDFYIGGYIDKSIYIVSILLGEYKGNYFYYVGNVILAKKYHLYKDILKLKRLKKSSFVDYNDQNVIYLEPKLKCGVEYLERTKNNRLRQAVIKNKKNIRKTL